MSFPTDTHIEELRLYGLTLSWRLAELAYHRARNVHTCVLCGTFAPTRKYRRFVKELRRVRKAEMHNQARFDRQGRIRVLAGELKDRIHKRENPELYTDGKLDYNKVMDRVFSHYVTKAFEDTLNQTSVTRRLL